MIKSVTEEQAKLIEPNDGTLPVGCEEADRDQAGIGSARNDQLEVIVVRRYCEADQIVSLELAAADGGALPAFSAGAHVDVHLDDGVVRQYSLCCDPASRRCYRLAVLREANSRGGSTAVHERLLEGVRLKISAPRNLFPLDETAEHSLLLSGGIGITPILAMAYRLHAIGRSFDLHCAVRNSNRAAFRDELAGASFRDHVYFYYDDGPVDQRLDLNRILCSPRPNAHIYCCGPTGLIDAATSFARTAGWSDGQIHIERFSSAPATGDRRMRVIAKRSGVIVEVPAKQTILGALKEAGVNVASSCEAGVCGTCLVKVLEGIPDHRDTWQTDEEKAKNTQILICCSRAKSGELVLDI